VGGINPPTNNQPTDQIDYLSKTYSDVYWDVDVGAGGHAAFDDVVNGKRGLSLGLHGDDDTWDQNRTQVKVRTMGGGERG